MGAAVAVGASVASGVIGLSEKNRQAKAQKQVIDAEQASRRMQADLQLFSLQQQKMVDNMNDIVTEAANTQAFMSTQQQLASQELLNTINTQQALLGADVQRASGQATAMQQEMDATKQQSDARLAIGAQALEQFAGASGEEQQLVNSVLQQMQSGNANANTIAQLLDFAASSGGVNEALQLLSGGEANAAERAGSAIDRASQLTGERKRLSDAAAKAGLTLADVERMMSNANTQIGLTGSNYQANMSELDARTAGAVNAEGFQAARVANDAQYSILNSSTKVQQQSRYLNNLANEYALQQGQELSNATLEAQRSSIRSPGFFDYAGVGLQGYNTYKSLGGKR